jgi:hypothetical protein
MIDTKPTYRINPPLSACLRWALKLLFKVAVAMTLITVGGTYFMGRPLTTPWTTLLGAEVAVIVGVGAFLGILIFGICRIWGTTLKDGAIRATTFGGRMMRVPLSSVTDARPGSVQGLPVLVVKSRATDSHLYIYTLGLDMSAAHARLASLAGPDHVLTRAFSNGV